MEVFYMFHNEETFISPIIYQYSQEVTLIEKRTLNLSSSLDSQNLILFHFTSGKQQWWKGGQSNG
jgi:hypothetical protein